MTKPTDKPQAEANSKEDGSYIYDHSWVCFRVEFIVVLFKFMDAMEKVLHSDWERTHHFGRIKHPATLLQPLGNYLTPNHRAYLKLYEQLRKELSKGQRKMFHRKLPPHTNDN